MTPGKLRFRLREQAKNFKYETDFIKGKVRELYKIAEDAISACELLESELRAFKESQPIAPPKPRTYFRAEPQPPRQSRADRVRAFMDEGIDSDKAKRFLKWMNLTAEEAMKIVESGE